MKMMVRPSRAGISIVELVLYVGFASFVGLIVSKYIVLPTRLNNMMNTVTNEQTSYSATALPVDDLKSAVSTSVQWNLIDPSQGNPPYDPAVNPLFIPWFQVNDPSIAPPSLPLSYVCYAYRVSDGALLREFISGGPPTASPVTSCAPAPGDNAQESVIAKNLIAPTAQTPLFSKDLASMNMVILNIEVHSGGPLPLTIVRRVHIRS